MPPARRRSRLAHDDGGTRGDISRHCGGPIGPGNSEDVGPRRIDGQPRDQSQGADRSLPGCSGLTSSRGSRRCARSRASWRCMARCGRLLFGKLELNWSPEQIAGWLKRASPETEAWRVSHETIYRSLYVQARGVLKKELLVASSDPDGTILALAPRNREGRSASARIPDFCCLDQRATGVGRGSGRTGPLRRATCSVDRAMNSYICHIGRTPLALRDASQGREQGNANRRRCIDPASKEAARRTLQDPSTWDRGKTRRPQASVQHGNRHRRSTNPVRYPQLAPLSRRGSSRKRTIQSPAAASTSPRALDLDGWHSQAELNKVAR